MSLKQEVPATFECFPPLFPFAIIISANVPRIFFGSWNIGTKPPPAFLVEFLRLDVTSCDIYVISLQEVVPLNGIIFYFDISRFNSSLVSNFLKKSENLSLWEAKIHETLGDSYFLVCYFFFISFYSCLPLYLF